MGRRGRGDKISYTVLWQFYYPTSDDWHPNYPRNTVLVSVYERTPNTDGTIYLHATVWGADDTGMQKELRILPEQLDEERGKLLREIDDLPNPLTYDWLYNRGYRFS